MDEFKELYSFHLETIAVHQHDVFTARLFEVMGMYLQMKMGQNTVNGSQQFSLSEMRTDNTKALHWVMSLTHNSKVNRAMGLTKAIEQTVKLCMNQAEMLIFSAVAEKKERNALYLEALTFLHAEFDKKPEEEGGGEGCSTSSEPLRPTARHAKDHEIGFDVHVYMTASLSTSSAGGDSSAFVSCNGAL